MSKFDKARIKELEKALQEIRSRTGLLLHQNAGHWRLSLKHDKRTFDVLLVNQEIASLALAGCDT